MRKVKNKKAVNRLSDKSFLANKTRNNIAILAIALTAMLFTALFTIGIGTIENFQIQTMRQSGGDSHGVIKNLTWEQYNKLKTHPLIKETAPCILVADEIKNPEFIKRHAEAWYYPTYHYKHCFVDIIDGRAPEKADEILLDDTSMELMGLEAKAGQQVTMTMQLRSDSEDTINRTFTVSGVTKSDPAMNVGFIVVSENYLKIHQSELTYEYDKTYSGTGTIRMDISFSNSFSVQKKLNQVIEESGYSIVEGDKNYLASNANWAYVSDGAGSDPIVTGAIICGLLLILVTGYLIIYNVFQISIIKDIQFYGLLKTIGTTAKQIKTILRRQALRLCVIGIPIGLFIGFFLGKWMVPFVMARSSYGDNEVSVSADPRIFIGSALFALVTVLISEGRPAKLAARVSPIEALRYMEGDAVHKKKKKKSTGGAKIWRMALSNLGRNKGKTCIIILSLSLSAILLNSVFTITRSFDMDTYLKKFVTSDFLVGNAKYFGMDHYYGFNEETVLEENLTESFVKMCEKQEGFEEGGRIYCTLGLIKLKKDSWNMPDYIIKNEDGLPGNYWNGEFFEYNQDEAGNYDTSFFGLENFPLKEIEVWKGEKDLSVIKEKLATGKYLLLKVDTDDNDNVIEDNVKSQPGDKVVLLDQSGQEHEFTILSLIKDNYYGLSNRMSSDFGFYTTADVFKKMVSDQFLMSYAFNVADDKETKIGQSLENYTTSIEPLMHYESKEKFVKEFSSLQGLVLMVGGVLSLVIAVIGILNFINSILTGIVTRRKEFAMMEAIGMTRKQLTTMIVLEGIFYAAFTCIFSLVLGCLFSVTGVKAMSNGMWFMKYHFVCWPLLLYLPFLLVLGFLVPKIVFHYQVKQSIVEEIRESQ